MTRAVIAWREPSLLVADCVGAETLKDEEAIEVVELATLADEASAVNCHLLT